MRKACLAGGLVVIALSVVAASAAADFEKEAKIGETAAGHIVGHAPSLMGRSFDAFRNVFEPSAECKEVRGRTHVGCGLLPVYMFFARDDSGRRVTRSMGVTTNWSSVCQGFKTGLFRGLGDPLSRGDGKVIMWKKGGLVYVYQPNKDSEKPCQIVVITEKE